MPSKRTSVSEHVMASVTAYLDMQSLMDGQVRQSLQEMSKALGISQSTIHRAIRVLESEGVIHIVGAAVPGQPQTIIHSAATNTPPATPAGKATVAIASVARGLHSLEKTVQEVCKENERLRSQLQAFHQRERRIVARTRLPDGKVVIVFDPPSPQ